MMDIGRSIFWTIRGPQYKMIDLSINFCELSAYLPMFRGLNYTPNPEKWHLLIIMLCRDSNRATYRMVDIDVYTELFAAI